jgi:hypothetical protein
LKERHGLAEPTDDSDEWTAADTRDAAEQSLQRWDRREGENAASAPAG